MHVCCTLCLPNALLRCEPSGLPRAFGTSLLLALYPLCYILLPSVTWLWNWTRPVQTSWVHRALTTLRTVPSELVSRLPPALTCLVVPSLCSTATVPCHHLPFSMTARQRHAQLEGDAWWPFRKAMCICIATSAVEGTKMPSPCLARFWVGPQRSPVSWFLSYLPIPQHGVG